MSNNPVRALGAFIVTTCLCLLLMAMPVLAWFAIKSPTWPVTAGLLALIVGAGLYIYHVTKLAWKGKL